MSQRNSTLTQSILKRKLRVFDKFDSSICFQLKNRLLVERDNYNNFIFQNITKKYILHFEECFSCKKLKKKLLEPPVT